MVFQGRLVRADGQPETSPQTLTFSIYASATGGTPLFTETHVDVPVNNGVYVVELGETQPLSNVFAGQVRYLGVALQSQSELQPRLVIASVPYALKAAESQTLGGSTKDDFAAASHGHGNATTSSSGFMSSSDKTKLNGVPTLWGNGLDETTSAGVTRVDVEYGGDGSATTLSRSDHSHPLPAFTCQNRSATGAFNAGATANCSAGEVLTGGGCTNVPYAPDAGYTVTQAPVSNGYRCEGNGSGVPTSSVTAWAICCKVGP